MKNTVWKHTKERILFAILIIPMFLLASLALLLGDIPQNTEE